MHESLESVIQKIDSALHGFSGVRYLNSTPNKPILAPPLFLQKMAPKANLWCTTCGWHRAARCLGGSLLPFRAAFAVRSAQALEQAMEQDAVE